MRRWWVGSRFMAGGDELWKKWLLLRNPICKKNKVLLLLCVPDSMQKNISWSVFVEHPTKRANFFMLGLLPSSSQASSSTWGWVSLIFIWSSHPHPPNHTQPHPHRESLFSNIFQRMLTNLSECWPSKVIEVGRRPQIVGKMEDDLKYLAKWKTTSIFSQNGRRPQF